MITETCTSFLLFSYAGPHGIIFPPLISVFTLHRLNAIAIHKNFKSQNSKDSKVWIPYPNKLFHNKHVLYCNVTVAQHESLIPHDVFYIAGEYSAKITWQTINSGFLCGLRSSTLFTFCWYLTQKELARWIACDVENWPLKFSFNSAVLHEPTLCKADNGKWHGTKQRTVFVLELFSLQLWAEVFNIQVCANSLWNTNRVNHEAKRLLSFQQTDGVWKGPKV